MDAKPDHKCPACGETRYTVDIGADDVIYNFACGCIYDPEIEMFLEDCPRTIPGRQRDI